MMASIMDQNGLDDLILRDFVHDFYSKIRRDTVLGPIFDAHITDWQPYLNRMAGVWSSVALLTGRCPGRPVPVQTPLQIDEMHFDRWLGLFCKTARVGDCPWRHARRSGAIRSDRFWRSGAP